MHAPLAATASAPKSKCIRVAVRVRPPMHPSVVAASASATGTAATAPAPVPPPVAVTAENDADGPCIRLRERVSDSFGHVHASEAVFRFDACYAPDTRQETVYNSEVKPWLDDCFTGVNTTVFCYGQTGSGKTHTAAGTSADAGLIPRAVHDLLAMRESRAATVRMSYMELYNERCIDLLVASGGSGNCNVSGGESTAYSDLPIREDAQRRVQVVGLTEHVLTTVDDFTRLFALGSQQRTCAATKLNAHSSRSHAVLQLKVERVVAAATATGASKRFVGKLNLIDLAGSEDNRHTGNAGARMAESGSINCSLFTFGKVIHALNAQAAYVPYRDSKLTRLLQDSLGGDAHAVMICCVAPEARFASTSASTLHFAQLSRKIVNRVQTHTIEERVAPEPHWSDRMHSAATVSSASASSSLPTSSSSSSSSTSAVDRKAELERWRASKAAATMATGALASSSSSTSTASSMQAPKRLSGGEGGAAVPDLSRKVAELEANVRALTTALSSAHATASATAASRPRTAAASETASHVTLVPLTPSTKSAYMRQHTERARAHHRAGDFASELIEYQKAATLAPENDALRAKCDALRATLNGVAAATHGGGGGGGHARARSDQENAAPTTTAPHVLGKRKVSPNKANASSGAPKRTFGTMLARTHTHNGGRTGASGGAGVAVRTSTTVAKPAPRKEGESDESEHDDDEEQDDQEEDNEDDDDRGEADDDEDYTDDDDEDDDGYDSEQEALRRMRARKTTRAERAQRRTRESTSSASSSTSSSSSSSSSHSDAGAHCANRTSTGSTNAGENLDTADGVGSIVVAGALLAYDGGGRAGELARALVERLNAATLKQLKALHTIGAKRAELIAQRRIVVPFVALSDLTAVGMSQKQIESFFEKNTLAAPSTTTATTTASDFDMAVAETELMLAD